MSEFLTTSQVQDLLQIDRTTIYRMLSDGRLSGVKIGAQWRFCKDNIDALLSASTSPTETPQTASFEVLPLTCLQGMQTVVSEAMGIGAIITDAYGEPLTRMSNTCRFCQLIFRSQKGRAACLADFSLLARRSGDSFPQMTCHTGLQCHGAAVKINGVKTAVFIAGQYQTSNSQIDPQHVQSLATAYDLDAAELAAAAAEVPILDRGQQQKVMEWLPKLTRTLSEIGQERADLLDRLQRIAVMSAV
ncbi:MAG: PocR ligand-binding domain-containing protein [Ardenticatenaceae bacterium]|nr:PocR ligand-binding domain-containing protein [Ardenticatenaceae bacterium]